MNATFGPERLAPALGAAALTVAATLSIGAGTATADPPGGFCACASGQHLDLGPLVKAFIGSSTSGGGAGVSAFVHSVQRAERNPTGGP